MWHDLGKFSPEFQQYLRQAHISDAHCAEIGKKFDHSTAGAQHAATTVATLGHLIAHVIAGHHSGLLDTVSTTACLKERLKKSLPPWQPNAQSFQPLQRA